MPLFFIPLLLLATATAERVAVAPQLFGSSSDGGMPLEIIANPPRPAYVNPADPVWAFINQQTAWFVFVKLYELQGMVSSESSLLEAAANHSAVDHSAVALYHSEISMIPASSFSGAHQADLRARLARSPKHFAKLETDEWLHNSNSAAVLSFGSGGITFFTQEFNNPKSAIDNANQLTEVMYFYGEAKHTPATTWASLSYGCGSTFAAWNYGLLTNCNYFSRFALKCVHQLQPDLDNIHLSALQWLPADCGCTSAAA